MYKILIIVLIVAFSFLSCKKETEEMHLASVEEYFPLEEGKYIIYDLDSILFTNFGQVRTTVSYEIKDEVDSKITDNQGREAYRIVRYIRKNQGESWQPNNTFTATATANTLEYVENNLRFIKLSLPIRNDHSWKGNSYLDAYSSDHDLSYYNNWYYTYDSVGSPLSIQNQRFNNTIKVVEQDELLGQDPSIPGTQYAEKTYSVAYYASGTGLIYREFMHWQYQGMQPGRPAYYSGYGIVQKIKSHN